MIATFSRKINGLGLPSHCLSSALLPLPLAFSPGYSSSRIRRDAVFFKGNDQKYFPFVFFYYNKPPRPESKITRLIAMTYQPLYFPLMRNRITFLAPREELKKSETPRIAILKLIERMCGDHHASQINRRIRIDTWPMVFFYRAYIYGCPAIPHTISMHISSPQETKFQRATPLVCRGKNFFFVNYSKRKSAASNLNRKKVWGHF